MDPLLLQKQLRENAGDLNEFYKELKSWGEEMKKKEEALKSPTQPTKKIQAVDSNKTKKVASKSHKRSDNKVKSKIGVTDYSAWDKFDADAECEKVDYDENEESELTDECDDAMRDEAFLHKEKGNKHVKNQKWDEAIKCYTKAIDCYALDPIFYANRALCYLKQQNMKKAEEDCTMSLKLDNTYVKAYQRRAAAREAQNKLKEAEFDLLKVLEFEPNNKESRKALDDLRIKLDKIKPTEQTQRPVSKFTASRNQKKFINQQEPEISRNIDNAKPLSQWGDDSDIIPVKVVNKPAHLRSKKPLKRLTIKEIEGFHESKPEIVAVKTRVIEKHEAVPKINESPMTTLKTDDFKIIERQADLVTQKEVKNNTNITVASTNNFELKVPKNSVQFYSQWRHLKTLDSRYNYLKLVKPNELPHIFKENLDSKVFSDILEVLAEMFIKHNDGAYEFLYYMTQLKRFSTFTLFLTDDDKNHLWKLFDYVKQAEKKPKEEVDLLIKKYELY